MSEDYRHSFVVQWRDLDPNGHMKNTAYLDSCVDTRLGYFASRGLSAKELFALGVGPVVSRDEVDYHRELHLQERYTVDLRIAGLSDDASHFRLQNRFYRENGKLAAKVLSAGGWLDLEKRRLVAAPEPIHEALHALTRTDDFETLRPSVRGL